MVPVVPEVAALVASARGGRPEAWLASDGELRQEKGLLPPVLVAVVLMAAGLKALNQKKTPGTTAESKPYLSRAKELTGSRPEGL